MNKKPILTTRYTQESNYEQVMSSSVADFWQQRESGYHPSFDGASLYWCKFTASHHTKAIVIVNGRVETVFKYQELFFDLFQLGYDIYSYDHRGQGHSKNANNTGEIGHVDQFQHSQYRKGNSSLSPCFDVSQYLSYLIFKIKKS